MDHDLLVALVPVAVIAIGGVLWRVVSGSYVPRSRLLEIESKAEKDAALVLANHQRELATLSADRDRYRENAEKYQESYRDTREALVTQTAFLNNNTQSTEAVLSVMRALQQPGLLSAPDRTHGGE